MYPSLKINLLTIAAILSISLSFGQLNTRSPYSLFGVGLMNYDGFADNAANGQNGIAYRYQSNFTFTNPASLSAVKNTVFNVGAFTDLGQFKTSTYNQDFSNAGFKYIALGVPILKYKSGLAFGLLPYSDIGYNIINIKDSSGVSLRNEFAGSGGLSKFNIGIGKEVFPFLSLGLNYSYVFGQLNENQKRRYPGNRFMTSYADNSLLSIKGSHLDLGLQLYTHADSALNHVLGISYSTKTNLKGEQDRLVYTFTEIYNGGEFPKDTLKNTIGSKAKVTLPNALNLSYAVGKGEIWQATIGFGKTMWNNYKSINGDNNGLVNDQNFSLGFFICPKPVFDKTNKAASKLTYFKSIRYTVGFYHNDGFINTTEIKISENALSLGLGLPFTKVHKKIDGSRTVVTSRIFITGQYIRRGTLKNNLIQEDYLKITLGLNLADSWFNKRLFN